MKPSLTNGRALAYMHLATLLFGFTAVLGKLITLNEFNLVWWRMLLASLFFLFIPGKLKLLKQMSNRIILIFFFIGFIVALHWLTFYGSIKLANSASVPLVCFGTVATFTAILEPIMLKRKFVLSEVLLGILVLVGLFFVARANPEQDFSWSSNYIKAIVVGVISAFLASIFSILNKKYIGNEDAATVTWVQMFGGWILLCLILPLVVLGGRDFTLTPSFNDWIYLLVLAVLCTNLAFSLEMSALKKVSAFTANLILNLEPVYGIIAAVIIFKEHEMLQSQFYLGAAIVLTAVIIGPVIKRVKLNSN